MSRRRLVLAYALEILAFCAFWLVIGALSGFVLGLIFGRAA